MNIRRALILLVFQVLLVASLGVQAGAQQATLVIPEELNVISVDNKKYTGKFFSSGDTTLKLNPGQRRILVEYEVILDVGADDHERIQSKPFEIIFNAEPTRQYFIKLPSFSQIEEIQKYAKKPVFELIDRSTSRAVATKVIYHSNSRGFFSQFSKPAVSTRPVHNPAPTPSVFIAPAKKAVKPPQTGKNATSSSMPLKMLRYWWGQASEEQRKAFIQSIQ